MRRTQKACLRRSVRSALAVYHVYPCPHSYALHTKAFYPPALQQQGDFVRLIDTLDSPYMRRMVISLRLLGLSFEYAAVSVLRYFDQFNAVNPVVKAPILVCDDGIVLIDSTFVINYTEMLVGRGPMSVAITEH